MICSTLSLNMSESKENSTLQELEMSDLPQGSPDELTKDVPTPMKAVQGQWMCNIKRCMFLILLVISSTILVAEINAAQSSRPDLPVVENGAFTFRVYCPYFYKPRAQQLLREHSREQLRRRLYQQSSYTVELPNSYDQSFKKYDFKNTYVIDMQSRKANNGTPLLYYCGYTRPFDSDCNTEVKYTCSSPGAMFDLSVSTYADIIWINNLSQQDAKIDNCMTSPEKPNAHCQLMVKSIKTQTFDDPTSHPKNQTTMTINGSQWPVTAHVHGAEVRPTFDGNPLSWFANDGSRGVGAFSLNDTCYYDKFDQDETQDRFELPPNLIVRKDGNLENRIKVNRYPNIQNPGNLWYHDHAMRLTFYNVQYGLSGLYMLRNQTVQDEIGVNIKNEKLIMMTTDGWKSTQNLESAADVVYRFRFLNNNFNGGNVFKIEFKYGACANNSNVIPFTIIGADSSLFNQGIYNQTSFIIAQAERMEIIINFDDNQKSYSICSSPAPDTFGPPNPPKVSAKAEHAATEHAILSEFSTNDFENIRLSSFESKTAIKNKRKDINNVTLSVPFTNFNNPNIPIQVKRMRPLMFIQKNSVFSINGRLDFHLGKSENPKIGTYEDWYLINTIGNGHPIHVHLINFQVIKVLNLRFEKSGKCTLYELDFIVAAILKNSSYINNSTIFPNVSDKRNVDYNYLCTIKNQLYNDQNFLSKLEGVNVEDQIVNGISGIDVEAQRDDNDTRLFQRLNISTAKGNGKYVTDEEDPIKPYYRKWKDTAFVEKYKVFVYRIRWAKSSYEDNSNDTPFHVPVDQLREYPGFVYHCHILNHEDKEMMRPIMLQLPDKVQLNPKTTCNNLTDPSGNIDYSWARKVTCINERCPKV